MSDTMEGGKPFCSQEEAENAVMSKIQERGWTNVEFVGAEFFEDPSIGQLNYWILNVEHGFEGARKTDKVFYYENEEVGFPSDFD